MADKQHPIYHYDDEGQVERLARKSKDAPFLMVGLAGLATACGMGAYMFKKRNISMSMFLMQLRVAAQGTVVGCLTIGIVYNMVNQYVLKDKTDKSQDK